MEMTPTAHNGAAQGQIAKKVLMPGAPLRAKYIAEALQDDVDLMDVVVGISEREPVKGGDLKCCQ